ncbi:MAG TPA: YkgJ family cysteine cluster protein [Marinilabiliaceae bacterium]|nr:YkgJ family cysteine cluster protein [Marinilabiliaceae bacterium]
MNEGEPDYLTNFRRESKNRANENRKFLERLRKMRPSTLDEVTESLHYKAFDHIDCLSCANCCKTTSPILIDKDIERISKRLRIKPSEMVETYLKLDKENDYVFIKAPCPFLMDDNYCMIYEDRPRACREYPHTNRKRFYQILKLSYHNTLVCPAVLEVVEGLKQHYNK